MNAIHIAFILLITTSKPKTNQRTNTRKYVSKETTGSLSLEFVAFKLYIYN